MGKTFNNLCDSCTNNGCVFQSGIVRTKCAFYMPPHLEPDNCGNYVVQESTTKNDLAVDCISRIETIDYLCKHCPDDGECFKDCDEIKHLRQMSSVTPQPKTGHWIYESDKEHGHCSKCGTKEDLVNGKIYNYCRVCGARMTESEVDDGNVD